MAVLSLLTFQYLMGAGAYVWPKLPLGQRRALGPLHSYLGKSIFVAGLATMAAGIQEKQVGRLTLHRLQPAHPIHLPLPRQMLVLPLSCRPSSKHSPNLPACMPAS